jgi:DNA-binding Lrp family transcriptional regulator
MADYDDTDQLKSGRYTIQIAVSTSQSAAKSLVKKMAANGIKAYYVEVNNPDKLYGLFYRVRIGFFNGKFAAENFAKNRLEPLGHVWWIDLSKNDTVGNSVVVTAPKSEPPPNSELEEAKREYKRIAEEATKAKKLQQKK